MIKLEVINLSGQFISEEFILLNVKHANFWEQK